MSRTSSGIILTKAFCRSASTRCPVTIEIPDLKSARFLSNPPLCLPLKAAPSSLRRSDDPIRGGVLFGTLRTKDADLNLERPRGLSEMGNHLFFGLFPDAMLAVPVLNTFFVLNSERLASGCHGIFGFGEREFPGADDRPAAVGVRDPHPQGVAPGCGLLELLVDGPCLADVVCNRFLVTALNPSKMIKCARYAPET